MGAQRPHFRRESQKPPMEYAVGAFVSGMRDAGTARLPHQFVSADLLDETDSRIERSRLVRGNTPLPRIEGANPGGLGVPKLKHTLVWWVRAGDGNYLISFVAW